MFTGIIPAVGTVAAIERDGSTSVITIDATGLADEFTHGESIAVNGTCLTVTESTGSTWSGDVMRITNETTTLGGLAVGDRVNLERAATAGTFLGGHIVQGHVDGVATLASRDEGAEWTDLTFEIPASIERYVAVKGSIALNGVSLTAAAVEGPRVTVSLIDTTLEETNLGALAVGDRVNVEVDVIAKYVEKMLEAKA